MNSENQQQFDQQQAIRDALANVPVVVPQKSRRSLLPLFFIALIIIFLIFAFIALMINGNKSTSEANDVSTGVSSSERTQAYREIAPSSTAVAGFIASIIAQDYAGANDVFVGDNSLIKNAGLTNETLNDIAAPNIDWSTCAVVEQETYSAAQLLKNNVPIYDIVYVPVDCVNTSNAIVMLNFDVRTIPSDSKPPTIFDIIMRTL